MTGGHTKRGCCKLGASRNIPLDGTAHVQCDTDLRKHVSGHSATPRRGAVASAWSRAAPHIQQSKWWRRPMDLGTPGADKLRISHMSAEDSCDLDATRKTNRSVHATSTLLCCCRVWPSGVALHGHPHTHAQARLRASREQFRNSPLAVIRNLGSAVEMLVCTKSRGRKARGIMIKLARLVEALGHGGASRKDK